MGAMSSWADLEAVAEDLDHPLKNTSGYGISLEMLYEPLDKHLDLFGQIASRGSIPVKYFDDLKANEKRWQMPYVINTFRESFCYTLFS